MTQKQLAVVTGGMGGLGESISTKMADAGYKVVVTYSPSNTKYKAWLDEMKGKGYSFAAYPVDVVSYEDDAVGLMPTDLEPMRITQITLRPHVVVAESNADAVVELIHEAHDQCYIANSLNCRVAVHPSVSMVERRKALS